MLSASVEVTSRVCAAVEVYVLTSPDEGRSWTAPRPIITEKGAFVRAACLLAAAAGLPPLKHRPPSHCFLQYKQNGNLGMKIE